MLGAICAGLLAPSSVLAQAAPAWQLHFAAPPGCPSEQTFRNALSERAVRPEASPRVTNHRITVTILHAEDEWNARLVVENAADGIRVERTARARNCDELVPALALMAALSLDLSPSSTREPPSHRAAVPARSSTPSGVVSAPPEAAFDLPGPAQPMAPTVPHLTEVELGFFVHWRSVVGFRDRAAVAPSVLWGSGATEGFAPWLRVSAEHVPSQVVTASGLEVALTWTLAQLDGCTHKWGLWGSAFISPCARVSVGALKAKGQAGVNTPRDPTQLWLTAGGGAEVALPIVAPLWLRVQGGFEALLLRQRVYAEGDPDRTVVEMPAMLGLLGVGLGVRIW